MPSDLWKGLREQARKQLIQRDYEAASGLAAAVPGTEFAKLDRSLPEVEAMWIPGVEIFCRDVFSQPFRGWFSELGREESGVCAKVGIWPRQWSVFRMFAGTAKGFHIHPPHVPAGEEPEEWFRRLYIEYPQEYSLRPYDLEQWDLMFAVAGSAEMILVDERAGMPRRTMRFQIDPGEAGAESAGVLIPPGVAHALQVDASADLLVVYGTTRVFTPESEGRIANRGETHELPSDWLEYLGET